MNPEPTGKADAAPAAAAANANPAAAEPAGRRQERAEAGCQSAAPPPRRIRRGSPGRSGLDSGASRVATGGRAGCACRKFRFQPIGADATDAAIVTAVSATSMADAARAAANIAPMFASVLIANRGEIACRIARTAKKLGLRTIAVYSAADAGALHVRSCDEAYPIGPPPPRESYLSIERIVDAAKKSGAECIHPGYGFLSENADFVEACDQAGIAFVGPPATAIRAMGLKDHAKALMEKAGVPVVPGYYGDRQDAKFLKEKAYQIGYPVLIKPAAGGGGRGLRRVDKHAEFETALESAIREAQSAFGSSRVLLEKYVAVAAPYRNPGVCRSPRQRHLSRRARLLAATAPSESDRGSAGPRHDRGASGTDGCRSGRSGEGGRLRRRRHGRIHRRQHQRASSRRVLVHRNEHAPASRASGDGGGYRP